MGGALASHSRRKTALLHQIQGLLLLGDGDGIDAVLRAFAVDQEAGGSGILISNQTLGCLGMKPRAKAKYTILSMVGRPKAAPPRLQFVSPRFHSKAAYYHRLLIQT